MRGKLQATGTNLLAQAGIDVDIDRGALEVAVENASFRPQAAETVEVRTNPIPRHRRAHRGAHRRQDCPGRPRAGPAGHPGGGPADGGGHYTDVADESGTSTSSVYRLLDALPTLLDSDNGVIDYADRLTRELAEAILAHVRDSADWASNPLTEAMDRVDALDRDGSPLANWMQRHGVRIIEQYPELEFKFGRQLSEHEVIELLRAGYQAVERSGFPTTQFLDATFSWTSPQGEARRNYRGLLLEGGRPAILRKAPLWA